MLSNKIKMMSIWSLPFPPEEFRNTAAVEMKALAEPTAKSCLVFKRMTWTCCEDRFNFTMTRRKDLCKSKKIWKAVATTL